VSDELAARRLADLLSQSATTVPPFGPSSRYYPIALATVLDADGNPIRYVKRRFLPDPDALVQIGEHVVSPDSRLDRIAADTLQDPELFWRICDANRCLHPDELTARVGRRLRIALPEGIPGSAT
jgi:hypothetical protein